MGVNPPKQGLGYHSRVLWVKSPIHGDSFVRIIWRMKPSPCLPFTICKLAFLVLKASGRHRCQLCFLMSGPPISAVTCTSYSSTIPNWIITFFTWNITHPADFLQGRAQRMATKLLWRSSFLKHCTVSWRCCWHTPWKMNGWKLPNHPFSKENDLNQTSREICFTLIFRGVFWWPYYASQHFHGCLFFLCLKVLFKEPLQEVLARRVDQREMSLKLLELMTRMFSEVGWSDKLGWLEVGRCWRSVVTVKDYGWYLLFVSWEDVVCHDSVFLWE